MVKQDQNGAANSLLIAFIASVFVLVIALVFGVWAFSSRQDFKNNVDSKVDTAVTNAVQKEASVKNAEFASEEQQPLTSYQGPEAYGSLIVHYPKNWSGYVDASGQGGGDAVNGYFNPGVVPSVSDASSVFALRVAVTNQSYTQTLQSYQGQPGVTSTVYSLPKLPSVVGVEITGSINADGQNSGTMVILPLRSETLEIWTDGTQNLADFNTNILPNFSFSP